MEEFNEEDDAGIWLSIGDMMSGLLMVFVLLCLIFLLSLNQEREKVEDQKAKIEELKKELEESSKTRIMVIKALTDALEEEQIPAKVDPETGDLSISDKILFEVGKATLQDAGKDFLRTFIPLYSELIFSEPNITKEISRVIIEGHTDKQGMQTSNFKLSLERSFEVTYFILWELDFPHKQEFVQLLQPTGRGELDANQEIPDEADRKVMFRFKFVGTDVEKALKNFTNNEKTGLSE